MMALVLKLFLATSLKMNSSRIETGFSLLEVTSVFFFGFRLVGLSGCVALLFILLIGSLISSLSVLSNI